MSADATATAPAWHRFEIGVVLVIVLLDQASKWAIRRALSIHDSITVVPGFLDFTHVRNSGAAFGFLNAVDFPFKTIVIAIVAVSALVGVAVYAKGLAPQQLLARWGLALIVGGAIGNLVDRLTVGSVVDFVDVYWRQYHFWAFNVADSAISVGVAVMILDMITTGMHASKTA
jgi:signal peptidase II